MFYIFDRNGKGDKIIDISTVPDGVRRFDSRFGLNGISRRDSVSEDFTKKSMLTCWHPTRDTVAVGISKNLHIYHTAKASPVIGR